MYNGNGYWKQFTYVADFAKCDLHGTLLCWDNLGWLIGEKNGKMSITAKRQIQDKLRMGKEALRDIKQLTVYHHNKSSWY